MQRYDHGGNIYSGGEIKLDFSENTNFLGLPEAGKRALADSVAEYSHYPDPKCRELVSVLAKHHGIDENMILCGNGAADMIFRTALCLQPKKAAVMAPTFSEYERPIKLFDGEVAEISLDEDEDFAFPDDLAAHIPAGTDFLALCTPNNPTGRLIPPEVIEACAARCRELGAVIMVDECFIAFTEGESVIPLLKKYDNLLILRAFTKLYAMAGLRLGYLLGAPGLLERIREYGPEWNVSIPAQKVGCAVLGIEPEWTQKTVAVTKSERDFMVKELTALGLHVVPSQANFLLIKSEKPLVRALLEKGILVRDCSNYTGLNDRYFRIGLKDRDRNLALLKAIFEVIL